LDIIHAYRSSEVSSSSLAERFGVSTSTVSRILKCNLAESVYEALIQQKRGGRSQPNCVVESGDRDSVLPTLVAVEDETPPPQAVAASEGPIRRQRKRSSVVQPEVTEPEPIREPAPQLALGEAPVQANGSGALDDRYAEGISVLEEKHREDLLGPELSDLEEDEDLDEDDLDDLDDDLDDDDLDDDGLDDDEVDLIELSNIPAQAFVQVLPLSEAAVPKTFYLVVDRAAELITRPLRDFGVLGQIPDTEVQERILPIFDNHRVARRFSRKTQRVIKVPEGNRMLEKTTTYLQAKGITRLLIDGQVYSLSD
ncbi:MAG: hypothetical protein SFW36_07280, partial [Leptolyngbyaceae cyanobacterium bins.59]|nr:hypothetical protein [Leptolyngbyaceae cyanobacterium bins.59]